MDGVREEAFDEEPRPKRLITLDAREGRSGSPRMGAVVGMGDPGVTPTAVRVGGTEGVDGAL